MSEAKIALDAADTGAVTRFAAVTVSRASRLSGDAIRLPSVTEDTRAATGAVRQNQATGTPLNLWIPLLVADLAGLLAPALTQTSGRLALSATALLSVLFLQARGFYRSRLHLSILDDIPSIIPSLVGAALIVGIGVRILELPPAITTYAGLALAGIAIQVLFRAFVYAGLRTARSRGHLGQNVVLVGGGAVATQIVRELHNNPGYGLRPVGYLDDEPAPNDSSVGLFPYLGTVEDLPRVVIDRCARIVIVAFAQGPESKLVESFRSEAAHNCSIFVVPRLYEIYRSGNNDHIGAIPVSKLRRSLRRSPASVIKRGIDALVALLALLLTSPLLIAAAIAIRIEGGPGVIFRQTRVGRGGMPFELLKLRSLKPVDDSESQTMWNVSHDSRLGPVGRFLRKTSIDELPQLWNVLQGQMSLVGPRPERPHFVEVFSNEHPAYAHRHRMRAGLTGLAQVNGLRGDTSIADRLRYDNYYIENWSLWLDIKIMIATFREVVAARGG